MSQAPLRPVPSSGTESTLFQEDGVLVTTERVVAGGRAWPLEEVLRVEALHCAPRVLPLLVLLGASMMLGFPALLSAMTARSELGPGGHEAALGCTAVVAFGSIAGLLMAQDQYWLVLWTRGRARRVFRSRDPQHISRLVHGVAEALQAARPRS
jgi:hypothetical protein